MQTLAGLNFFCHSSQSLHVDIGRKSVLGIRQWVLLQNCLGVKFLKLQTSRDLAMRAPPFKVCQLPYPVNVLLCTHREETNEINSL